MVQKVDPSPVSRIIKFHAGDADEDVMKWIR
jgi:hypothetical protein